MVTATTAMAIAVSAMTTTVEHARRKRDIYIYTALAQVVSSLMHPPCPSHRSLRSLASALPIRHLLSRSILTLYALSPERSQSLSTETSCP